MTWIKTVLPKDASKELRDAIRGMLKLYPVEYGTEVESLKRVASPATGGGISASHSLLPSTLLHAFSTLGTLLSPDLPLSRTQHEMIAAVVSITNDCFY